MPRELENTRRHPWEDIVNEISQETDPTKVRMLARKLNEAMLAEEKKKHYDALLGEPIRRRQNPIDGSLSKAADAKSRWPSVH